MGRVTVAAKLENPEDLCMVALEFVLDPNARRLIGNPAHGGGHVIELS
jgi:hypothetical protein